MLLCLSMSPLCIMAIGYLRNSLVVVPPLTLANYCTYPGNCPATNVTLFHVNRPSGYGY